MKLLIKQFIIIVLIVLAVLSIVFGSYLPLVKAQRFITALNLVPSIKTVEEFKTNFDRVFKFYSPVGDEEVVKFLTVDILRIISQENQTEEVSRMLVEYIEPYIFQDDVRHLLFFGEMYRILWQKFGREEDFQKAENYYQKALVLGPRIPPILYGLLELYRIKGDNQKIKEIGEIILKYWPDALYVKNLNL